MSARFIVGDTRAVTATLPDQSVDFLMTSPPFLALRSYLPADHPDKALEIGSEATPAAFIDVLLELSAEWRRVLAPHGSIVVELGDTYAGSGGAGGDYDPTGWRMDQPRFAGSGSKHRMEAAKPDSKSRLAAGDGWPRPKSLTLIPEAYHFALAYGVNPHTGQASPAGRWQIRNKIRRCSPNPPVGALGKKWRNGVTELVVATPDDDRRYWDDIATRVAWQPTNLGGAGKTKPNLGDPDRAAAIRHQQNLAKKVDTRGGAPLLDWWNLLQRRIDRALQQARNGADGYTADDLFGGSVDKQGKQKETPGGKLIREAWENGEIDTGDWWPFSGGSYEDAHFAVYRPELCVNPIEAMCPRRVCRTCGEPSRRETSEPTYEPSSNPDTSSSRKAGTAVTWESSIANGMGAHTAKPDGGMVRTATTTGWSTCGCPGTDGIQLDGYHTGEGWRPGVVFDPFAGTGTTLAVATGHGRDAIGIDLDPRNAHLALDRVGPLMLSVEHLDPEAA